MIDIKKDWLKVGQVITTAAPTNYLGVITRISKDEDVVQHRCLRTGQQYEKSYFGFFCRYTPAEEAGDDK